MKYLQLIITILALYVCSCRSSADYRKEANALEKKGKYREAILLLTRAIDKDPKNIKAYLDRGVDKSYIKDHKGSIEDYSKVIELDPGNTLAYLNRGKAKARLKDDIEAINDFTKAISTKGSEQLYIDKVESKFIETGFEYDVLMEEIRLERGYAYFNIDSLRKAFDDINFCIEKNFELPGCYYIRGSIYLSYKMNKEACKDLNKAKELGDTDAPELLNKYCK
jgi:tetratricopeptide (TPR) repeat protein